MNILMSLMQLDIGGAETHVVELAKELKRRGHNIIITSNGGAYVEELEKSDIKHYVVPLHSKQPKYVIKAFSVLKKIIIEEKIDLVHSHARIPSFILGKLQKSMKFPYVTTAHWIFTTKYGLKYITDWGQKTLAVSEDIKKYLMDNYKIPETDITVTVNGIDIEKFSADIDKALAEKEFGLNKEDNTIVYVSRMDESRSLVAHQLIEAIVRLDNIVENLKCVIVGDGDDFENVKKEADATNEKLGRNAIMLAGARTDINKIIAPAKLFIGVSRAALEAMACEKPTIIAGNEGYIGLFDEDKLSVGLSTNFCCRGCPESDTDVLTQDIGGFFGLWEEEQAKLAAYGRKTVIENYSVKRMADDAEKVYKEVMGASV
ncbi:MAG: glycosyltransferase [Clostridia bacterium]|nr:glycosyltransferase [Clostridia bacterium]